MIFKSQKIGGICLLISQALERIAFYSVLANFVYILNSKPLQWSSVNAMNATLILSGFCFVATMFGGILSDTVIKKSTTVIIGYVFYSMYILYIVLFYEKGFKNFVMIQKLCDLHESADIMFGESCANYIIPATIFTAIGSGLIKSVIASIGADMAMEKWKNPSVFFNMYYWSLNFGSLIAYALIAYIQQELSRFYGYLVPGILLVFSFGFFMLGMPYYINLKKPSRSTLNMVFCVYLEAFKKTLSVCKSKDKKTQSKTSLTRSDDSTVVQGSLNQRRSITYIKRKAEYPSLTISYRSDSEDVSDDNSTIVEATVSASLTGVLFLDRSKIRFGGSFLEEDVEDVRKFSNVMIILIFLIPYWILYFQMETTFLNQGLHMKLEFPQKKFSFPPCWLSIMDILAIMFLLPILVKFVYPYLRERGMYPRYSTRLIYGMVLAMVSVCIAGVVQIFSQLNNGNFNLQNIGGTNYSHSNISVFIQLPQYFIMGMSESQAIVAGLEIACTQVPNSMQGMTNGIFWFISGIGSFIGTGILATVKWNDTLAAASQSKHEFIFYFFWLALIQAVGLLLFGLYVYRIRRNETNVCITVTDTI